ncbi:MAG: endonuclease MutS2 [Thermomicrobiales bacterium]|nr:endonuclease MutS2 [Thermomicrobiales bacterium]
MTIETQPSQLANRLNQSLTKLEYQSVVAQLARRCHYSVAVEMAERIEPEMSYWAAADVMAITDEAVAITIDHPGMSVGGARDIRALLDRAEKGGRLQAQELQDVADTVAAARIVRQQILGTASAGSRFPRLVDWATGLALMPHFEDAVRRSIGPAGEILDTASEKLARVRREVRITHQRLIDRLNRLVSGGSLATALQDNLFTTRDGRYVIPVRSDARAQVPGIVHDSSASGQTLFVEPMDVVDMNNRWREAQIEERHEIERILGELSAIVGSQAEALDQTVQALAQIDLALAKSRLAVDWRCTRPALIEPIESSDAPVNGGVARFHFRKARHPLLDPQSVVPIDVEAGESFRILLITGPNTGGKTVALKTVGLLTMMAQSGLYVPAADGARTSVFGQLFVDIGDDQSIAQSLSTFSSHITNVIGMLQQVDATSLVLIDELGTGTDPQEGSALARAVVAELVEKGAIVVATTHFSEVKTYAYERPEIENASVEFDVETLSPTYRLMMGIPGQSNALAIAGRLGMPRQVLDHATTFLNPDAVKVDALLADIQRKGLDAERALADADRLKDEAATLVAARQSELDEARQLRFQAYEEARSEAEVMLAEGRRSLRRLQRAVAQPQAAPAPADPKPDAEVAEIAAAVSAVREVARQSKTAEPATPRLREGDRVRIRSLDTEGSLVRLGPGEAAVQLGTMRITRPLDDIVRIGGAPKEAAARVQVRSSGGGFVPIELDLRGYRYADIEPELDRYLDAAVRASLPFVRIIHGRGTGALRKGVGEYLRSSPVVDRFNAGKENEGGDGVTVVHLRD